MNWNKRKGLHYENQAKNYLVQHGLALLKQNYHCRFGEIDLIMLQQEVLCFIEVKYRNSMAYGGAASSISTQKQKKIVKTALFFITENEKFKQHSIRFDALLIQQQADNKSVDIDWIQNAFYAE
jgi:putative endonuclease